MAAEVGVAHSAQGGADYGITVVTLRHSGRLNAMSRAMWLQLRSVFADIQSRDDVRCVLLRGDGEAFCAGGDISEYPSFRFDPSAIRQFHEVEVWGGLDAILQCDVPVVAAISGACMGAGVEIASCCDIRVAGESARFGAPIAKLGFPMAPNEARLVAMAVGDTVTRQMLLEAATFSADQMLQHGFLSRVVPDAQLHAQAMASAQRIAALAPCAARLNKQTLRTLRDGGERTGSSLVALPDPYAYAPSAEHREGIAAFLEKRSPVF